MDKKNATAEYIDKFYNNYNSAVTAIVLYARYKRKPNTVARIAKELYNNELMRMLSDKSNQGVSHDEFIERLDAIDFEVVAKDIIETLRDDGEAVA